MIAYNLGNLLSRLVLPVAIQSWSLTSLQQRLFKTGAPLVRNARYLTLQLAESYLTGSLFRQILALMFILQIAGWFIFSCILMSFIEHQVHRRLMHRRNFLSAHTASFKRVFEAHALVHHKHYAEIFSDEPVARGEDKEIRLTVRKAPIKAIPIAALIALVSWQGAAVFVAAMIFHHWAWNKLHLEMHKPEQRVFSTWPVYKFLARYHCLHHRHRDRNFNVVFPLADYVLGTSVRANEADLKYMEQWGL